MLLSFSVSNYRSFRDEQTFSMVASSRHADHLEHLIPVPDDENKILPVAAIYGANGAGKSNLVRALQFFLNLVIEGTAPRQPMGKDPFLLDQESAGQPVKFSLHFVEDGRVYAYGISISDKMVDEEWLSIIRNGKEIPVFERVTREDGQVIVEAGAVLTDDSWGKHAKVVALSKVGALPNQLFLHGISQSLREEDQGPVMKSVLRWFSQRLVIVPPDSYYTDLVELIARNSEFAEFAGNFLRGISTGVNSLRVETTEMDENALAAIPARMREAISRLPVGETTSFEPNNDSGSQIIIEKGTGTKVLFRTVKSEHLTAAGDAVRFPFAEESDGTRRITQLLPALHSVGQGRNIFVIDEIDRSLHPLLAKGFVREFLNACVNKGAQLIFTTHDTTFLDLDHLRRDEIWFANKKMPEGATELYSLSDYKVRTDLKIDKAYLQGRFNAVPPIEVELPDWVNKIMADLRPQPSEAIHSEEVTP